MVSAPALVVATGGLSIPKIGASGLGFELARQFGLQLVPTRPGLVPLTFGGEAWAPYAGLAELALPVLIATGEKNSARSSRRPAVHPPRPVRPAVLQISSYWQPGAPLTIDLAPGIDLAAALREAKAAGARRLVARELAQWLPARLAEAFCADDPALQRPLAEAPDKALARLAERLQRWQLTPSGTEGYAKAEVTVGGVDTRDLSSQTLEARQQPGLYFIGEVVDVTGWLGGYNFQWAWASAHACAEALGQAAEARRAGGLSG